MFGSHHLHFIHTKSTSGCLACFSILFGSHVAVFGDIYTCRGEQWKFSSSFRITPRLLQMNRLLTQTLCGWIQKSCRCSAIANHCCLKLGSADATLTSQGFWLARPAGDNKHPQSFQMNKSCGGKNNNTPWRTPGSKKCFSPWLHFCPVFEMIPTTLFTSGV